MRPKEEVLRADGPRMTLLTSEPESSSSPADEEVQSLGVQAPQGLVTASLAYMALPTLIFVAGWTRPLIALAAGACTIALLVLRIRSDLARPGTPLPRVTTAGIWGSATVMGLLTGAGGFLPQTWDWLKHNAILRDLVVEPWPVIYEVDGQAFQLTYYIGYYLPAAAVGKVAGWPAANAALLLWTILGMALTFTWFCVLTKAVRRGWILLVAALFSGPDLLGWLLLPILGLSDPRLPSQQLDWWAQIGKFPNHLTSVMWGPHHALAAWVGAGVILHLARTRQVQWILPVVAFSGLLSPFVTLGLLPLVGYALVRDGRHAVLERFREMLSGPTALATVAVAPVLVYYTAIAAPMPAPFGGSVPSGFAITNPIVEMSVLQAIGAYLMLIALEVLVFYVIVRRSHVGKEPDARLLLGIVTVSMVLFPLVRYGTWSDLAMRAVVPSMFVLSIFIGRIILDLPRTSKFRLALLYFLVLSLKAPQMELFRAVSDSHVNGQVVKARVDAGSAEATDGIVVLRESIYGEQPRFLAQYAASTETFFSENVARNHSGN